MFSLTCRNPALRVSELDLELSSVAPVVQGHVRGPVQRRAPNVSATDVNGAEAARSTLDSCRFTPKDVGKARFPQPFGTHSGRAHRVSWLHDRSLEHLFVDRERLECAPLPRAFPSRQAHRSTCKPRA